MKTMDMIYILRCNATTQDKCKYCPSRKACQSGEHGLFWEENIANRLEQLLVHLRSTKEQNGKLASDVAYWKHRYESLLKDVSKVVHERELLDLLNK